MQYTKEAGLLAAERFEPIKHVIPELEWPIHGPYLAAIDEWKRERNAVILAHNYQTPEIYHGVADIVGDSLALAIEAARTPADVIVVAGVHFMAESAKLLNPDKIVLIPDEEAGCSLASSISAADVRLLRERHPGVPVVSYVNTSAAVKAESDVCCTSSNAVDIVRSLRAPRVIFLPDRYLADYVAKQLPDVEIVAWAGSCEVHERFTAAEIRSYRSSRPGITVLAHPECPPEVLAEADFVGSTAAMSHYVGERKPASVVMITECSMSDNVAADHPEIEFVRPCNLCPHMKRITLPKILEALLHMRHEVRIEPDVADRARAALQRMLG